MTPPTRKNWAQATTSNVTRPVLVHDVMPEVFGLHMSSGEVLERSNSIALASSVVVASKHTAKGFLNMYPTAAAATPARPVWVTRNGVDNTVFLPQGMGNGTDSGYGTSKYNGSESMTHRVQTTNEDFRRLAGLDPGHPYVMIVGSRHGQNNARIAYRALSRKAAEVSMENITASSSPLASHGAPALVLVGGGPVKPNELDMLADVGTWSHIGVGSRMTKEGGERVETAVAVVDDGLLAAGYSGALALLHLSLAEGLGLDVLEAFACGCPVVAVDSPAIREIAGLSDLEDDAATDERTATREEALRHDENNAGPANTCGGEGDDFRRGGVDCYVGGLVLVKNPTSAAEVRTAVRAVAALGPDGRAAASDALVRRAKAFHSWQPLADTLIAAAVDRSSAGFDYASSK